MILPIRVTSMMNFEDQPVTLIATQAASQQLQLAQAPPAVDPDLPTSPAPIRHTSVLTQRRVERFLALTPEQHKIRANSLLIGQEG
jgi:hypothetical protein